MKDRLPPSLRRAVSDQMASTALKSPLSTLSDIWKSLAFNLIDPNQMQEIYKARPQFQKQMSQMKLRTTDHEEEHTPDRLSETAIKDFLRPIIEAHTSRKMSLLHLAAVSPDPNILRLMLGLSLGEFSETRTADLPINTRTASAANQNRLFWGWTPLHSAVMFRKFAAVASLLEAGADVNLQLEDKAPYRWAPWHLSLMFKDTRILRLLLRQPRLDFSIRDSAFCSYSVAHYAIHLKCDVEDFKALVQKRPSLVNAVDQNKTTPLHLAVMYSNFPVVRYLTSMRAKVNALNASHQTPLHLAYDACRTARHKARFDNQLSAWSPEQRAELLQDRADKVTNHLSSPAALFDQAMHEDNVMHPYQKLVSEAPAGRDVFHCHALGFSAWLDFSSRPLHDMVAHDQKRIDQATWCQFRPFIRLIPSYKDVKEIEVNVSEYLRRRPTMTAPSSVTRYEGQKGETQLSNTPQRAIVYWLLDHDASSEAVCKKGFTPECCAYDEDAMERTYSYDIAQDTTFRPSSPWSKAV